MMKFLLPFFIFNFVFLPTNGSAGHPDVGVKVENDFDGDARGVDRVSGDDPFDSWREDSEFEDSMGPTVSPSEGSMQGSGVATEDNPFSFQPSNTEEVPDSQTLTYTVDGVSSTITVPAGENSSSTDGLTDLGDLELETSPIEYRNGSEPQNVRKLPGVQKYSPIKVRRPTPTE